ncbi:hypothetical protein JXA47_15985, partial [Candidatus Sumerlaeota bacterium]|nr:hypothetical protein [Candidatus Sumerlaeota bacterium]
MFRRVVIITLALVCAASWLFTLHVARRAFHMTPDAVDYLTIARQRALGRGWTMPIKWCWADDSPAVHSALGERPLAWPALARYAVLIDPENPGPPAQVLNTFLIGLAAIVWGFAAAQIAGSAIAGWLTAAMLLTSATTLFVTTAALTEPLYLLELGLMVLLIGSKSQEKISPAMQGALLGLLTAALYLTRPTGPIVVLAFLLHFILSQGKGWRKRFALWALVAVPLLALWHFAVWRAWGDPFHNLTSVHLHVLNITEVMIRGWGLELPSVGALFAAHGDEILAKWGEHLLLHTEALIEPGALGLLAPLLALVAVQAMSRWRPWALLWLLALGHWLGAVLTWATTEPARLTLPTFICLLPLCLAAATDFLRNPPLPSAGASCAPKPLRRRREGEKGGEGACAGGGDAGTACCAPTLREDKGGEGAPGEG